MSVVISMLENGKMEENMDKVYLPLQMAQLMKANGKMETCMVKVNVSFLMVVNIP
eukprot:gene8803-11780_t